MLTDQTIPRSEVKPGETFHLGTRKLVALDRNIHAHVRWPHMYPGSFGFGVLRGDVDVLVWRDEPKLTFADLEPGERFRWVSEGCTQTIRIKLTGDRIQNIPGGATDPYAARHRTRWNVARVD